VTENNKPDDQAGDTTSAFTRADMPNELEAGPASAAYGGEVLTLGSALLVVKRGPNAGSRFQLNRPVTSMGRHPNSDVFLDDITVSRRHAELRWENDELQIVDMGSLNGTYVNGKTVQAAVLANGDEVRIGKFRLVLLSSRIVDRPGEPGSV
jgi:pSer/pThr/pTyr-binding forkhead associated (FHA) protein